MYTLRFDVKVQKQLNKIDDSTRKRIIKWLKDKIDGCENPRLYGKALVGNLNGLWRYRIGDYRVLVNIEDENLIVLAVKADHRRKVYE